MKTRKNPGMFKIAAMMLCCLYCCVLFVSAQNPNDQKPKMRNCGSNYSYNDLIRFGGGEFRKQYENLEIFTRQYIQNINLKDRNIFGADGARASSIIIPVVVHIVYNTPEQNISDAQIQDQINILNRDYRALNTEVIPTVFSGVRADMQIEFRLAVRDPHCNTTTGIHRVSTTATAFDYPQNLGDPTLLANNPVKDSAAGGVNAWPASKYLNIWVCKFKPITTGGTLFGYSSFPGFPANVDGVVIDYRCFGSIGTGNMLSAEVAGGRTAVHETGHWFNLYHNFQDGCSGTSASDCGTSGDHVCDTPPESGPTPLGACPALTLNTCTETPMDAIDMWMNFMDYSSDYCYSMFTSDQKLRLDASIYGARSAILSSDALIPVASGGTADLWMQDKPDDVGVEPNITSDAMYESEDIWIRNASGTTDQQHQNPVSNTNNYVYVRVRNRVCGTTGTGTLKLYWAKASSGLSWPAPWDGSVSGPPSMGNLIGSQPINISGASSQILTFTWNVPNLADYASFGADSGHFCLLARIETSATAPYGMTFAEVAGDLWNNVKNNNNIAWKNVEVVSSAGGGRSGAIIIANNDDRIMKTRLVFSTPLDVHEISFFDAGRVFVKLDEKLFASWQKGGQKGVGIIAGNDKLTLEITKSGAYIEGIELTPRQITSLKVHFDFTKHLPWAIYKAFHFRIDQYAMDPNGIFKIKGGQDFLIRNTKTAQDELQSNGNPIPWWKKYWWILLIILIILGLLKFLNKKK